MGGVRVRRETDVDHSSSSPTRNSELVIALDPAQIGGLDEGTVFGHCERLYERVLRSEGTQLPSTGRHCGTDRMAVRKTTENSGIDLPAALVDECKSLADDPKLITNEYLLR